MWICPKQRFSWSFVLLHFHCEFEWFIYATVIYIIFCLDSDVWSVRRQTIISTRTPLLRVRPGSCSELTPNPCPRAPRTHFGASTKLSLSNETTFDIKESKPVDHLCYVYWPVALFNNMHQTLVLRDQLRNQDGGPASPPSSSSVILGMGLSNERIYATMLRLLSLDEPIPRIHRVPVHRSVPATATCVCNTWIWPVSHTSGENCQQM